MKFELNEEDKSKDKPAVTFFRTKTVVRTLFGIPLSIALLVGLCVPALAFVAYIGMVSMPFNVGSSAVWVSDMPSSLNAVAGSNYTYSINASNTANEALNYVVEFSLNGSGLATSEAKLVLRDHNNNLVAENFTGVGDKITVRSPQQTLSANGGKLNWTAIVQTNSSIENGSYSLSAQLLQGDFAWAI